MEKKLFKLLLKKECFQSYRGWLQKDYFSGDLADIYDVLVYAHNKYEGDLSTTDLAEVYKSEKRLSAARAALVDSLFEEIEEEDVDEINSQVFEDIIATLYRKSLALQIANEAALIHEDKEQTTTILSQLCHQLTEVEGEKFNKTTAQHTTRIDELFTIRDEGSRIAMPIPCLAGTVPFIERGNSLLIFGRPEVGKSSLVAQTTANLIRDKQKTIYIANEEPTNHIMFNIVRAYFQKTEEEIRKLPAAKIQEWNDYAQYLSLYDGVGFSVDNLHSLCERVKPDILILDQTDKLTLSTTYNKAYERLQALYVSIREVAKRQNLAVFNITQASAEGEGRMNLNFSMMAGSKTDKAAEVDFIVGIGQNKRMTGVEDGIRYLSVSKNKLNGWHGTAIVGFDPSVCHYKEL